MEARTTLVRLPELPSLFTFHSGCGLGEGWKRTANKTEGSGGKSFACQDNCQEGGSVIKIKSSDESPHSEFISLFDGCAKDK